MAVDDRESIREQLAAAGDALARAELDRKNAMTKVRAAVRAAHAAEVPIKQIAELVGVTRPTVYKLLEGS